MTAHEPAAARRARARRCRAFRAMPKVRCSASRGRRRPSRWRSRCISAACSPGRNGQQPSPTRSSAPRRRAIPTPARPITGTGSMRSSAWSRERRRHRRHPAALPGRLGPCRRPHAARRPDRAPAGRFRVARMERKRNARRTGPHRGPGFRAARRRRAALLPTVHRHRACAHARAARRFRSGARECGAATETATSCAAATAPRSGGAHPACG